MSRPLGERGPARSTMSLCVLLLAGSVVPSLALADAVTQGLPACSPSPPYFCVDAACFLRDSAYVVEIYLSMCNEGLQFVRSASGYDASADVSVVLLDSKSVQATGDTYRIKLHASQYEGTTAHDSCQSRLLAFDAIPGEFSMDVGVYDRESRTRNVLRAPITVPLLTDLPSVSDVELMADYDLHDGARDGSGPNVRRRYDSGVEQIKFYYEVYHGAELDSLAVTHEVLDFQGRVVYQARSHSVGAGAVPHVEAFPADSLVNGRYLLRVAVNGSESEVVARRSKEFEISGTRFFWSRDSREAVALLTYIAPTSVIDAFEKGSEEDKRRVWEEFWREKDTTPGTPRNEYYEEHLRRFRYANEHFGVPLTPGWRSDRGRIYIIYGPPDEIESYPFEMGRRPTEVWYYFSGGRRFVFVDETGFGDYVLDREGH